MDGLHNSPPSVTSTRIQLVPWAVRSLGAQALGTEPLGAQALGTGPRVAQAFGTGPLGLSGAA